MLQSTELMQQLVSLNFNDEACSYFLMSLVPASVFMEQIYFPLTGICLNVPSAEFYLCIVSETMTSIPMTLVTIKK